MSLTDRDVAAAEAGVTPPVVERPYTQHRRTVTGSMLIIVGLLCVFALRSRVRRRTPRAVHADRPPEHASPCRRSRCPRAPSPIAWAADRRPRCVADQPRLPTLADALGPVSRCSPSSSRSSAGRTAARARSRSTCSSCCRTRSSARCRSSSARWPASSASGPASSTWRSRASCSRVRSSGALVGVHRAQRGVGISARMLAGAFIGALLAVFAIRYSSTRSSSASCSTSSPSGSPACSTTP